VDPALIEIVFGDPLAHLDHPDPRVRRIAVAGCAGREGAWAALVGLAASDPAPDVRAEAVEVLAGFGPKALEPVMAATGDEAAPVVEAAATALGELGAGGIPWLLTAAQSHPDALVQEAAVASLGAIGDSRALPLLLELAQSGKPQIRRRSLVALSAFEGEEAGQAFLRALGDRNPMVREVAEMVVGKQR
jgi:HEAT repeat protein